MNNPGELNPETLKEIARSFQLSQEIMRAVLDDYKENAEMLATVRTRLEGLGENVTLVLPLLAQFATLQARVDALEKHAAKLDSLKEQSILARWQFWATVLAAFLGGLATAIAAKVSGKN